MKTIGQLISAVVILLALVATLLSSSSALALDVLDGANYEFPEGLRGSTGGIHFMAAGEQIQPVSPPLESVGFTGGTSLPEPSSIVLGSAAVAFSLLMRRRKSL